MMWWAVHSGELTELVDAETTGAAFMLAIMRHVERCQRDSREVVLNDEIVAVPADNVVRVYGMTDKYIIGKNWRSLGTLPGLPKDRLRGKDDH